LRFSASLVGRLLVGGLEESDLISDWPDAGFGWDILRALCVLRRKRKIPGPNHENTEGTEDPA